MIRMSHKREEIVITDSPHIARRRIRYNAAVNARRALEMQFPDLFSSQPTHDSNGVNLVYSEAKSDDTQAA